MTNLAAYAPWNESDNTWLASNGTFEDFWTHTYRLIRSLDATTPIQGPSLSDNIGDMQNFLQNAVATDTVPDVLAWHELETSSKIAGDVAKVQAMEDALGIARRPIDIEEYAAPAEVGIPGDLVGYIAKFERLGIRDAELAFWNQSGALGDLLTGQGGNPNGAYWMYKWYADMNGDMVTTTPPGNNDFDAAASVTADKKELDVITGGTAGPASVKIAGLDKLAVGSKVNVKVEFTPAYGRTVAVSGSDHDLADHLPGGRRRIDQRSDRDEPRLRLPRGRHARGRHDLPRRHLHDRQPEQRTPADRRRLGGPGGPADRRQAPLRPGSSWHPATVSTRS